MGHGLTTTDGMFTVRQAAWHDLGVVFEDYPSRAEAQQIAHPWEPVREDIFRQVQVYTVDDEGNRVPVLDEHGEPVMENRLIQGWYANVRSDNGYELGVVSDKYVTVKNSELWDIAEALEQSGSDVMFETGGSLRGGSQVWVLVRLQEPLVVKGDPRGETIPYFALQNSHDGSGSFRGQATMTRIVCMNTSQVADLDARARGTEFMFKHTKNVSDRISQARDALSSWRQAISDWQVQQEHLISVPVTNSGVEYFLDKFIPMPPENLISERVRANVEQDRAKWMGAYTSITGEGIENTVYGLVQASTEFAEHYRKAQNAESRFKRTFLARNRLVSDAVTIGMDASKIDAAGSEKLVLV